MGEAADYLRWTIELAEERHFQGECDDWCVFCEARDGPNKESRHAESGKRAGRA